LLTVIARNLFDKPKTITLNKALQIIENDDPFVTTDWHIGKFFNKKQSEDSIEKYKKESNETIKMIDKAITAKQYNPVLCLGDISEKEMDTPDKIKWLYNKVRALSGYPKILIRGNNDDFDSEFYARMGFQYVSDTYITSNKLKIIFSHIPVSVPELNLDPKVWINVHGHVHGTGVLYNMKPDDAMCHIDVYHKLFNQGIHKLSWYLSMFRSHPNRYKTDIVYKYGWS
jgi:calcineurin-like phosphoesterase family protein